MAFANGMVNTPMTGTVTATPGVPVSLNQPYNPLGAPTSATTSVSQQSGAPVVVQTPQSLYQLQLAQQIAKAGQNLYGWAQNQYGYVKGLANEAIPQYLQGAATSNQLAGEQLGQYENLYAPAMARFNEMANSYASAPRQAYAMGQAESDATQNANAAWQNTKNDLISHGIDPSSGEYAGLKAAANTAAGASAAGAAQQARQGVENTGIGLQEQNINFGSTLPASALNAINTGYGGLAGAVNAGESAVNTGANAFGTANNFYQTAMGINAPTSGQGTSGSSASVGGGWTPKIQGGNIGGGGNSASAAQGGVIPDREGHVEGGIPDRDSYRRGGHIRRPRGLGAGVGGTGDPVAPHSPGVAPGSFGGSPGYNSALQSDAELRARTGSTPPPRQNLPGMVNHPTPGDTQWSQAGNNPVPILPDPAANSGFTADSAGGIPDGGGAARGGPMQPHGHQGRPHPPHPYTINGLPDASTGGHIPYELSPSHGHTTDDVVANLNAGEFVLPRRTVHHIGHKALYKLIADADKEMGLHPQPVGAKPVKPGSGADKARSAAEGQNFLSGGGI